VTSAARCGWLAIPLPLILLGPSVAAAAEKSGPSAAISVNYPTLKGDRFVTLTLDGFPQHKLSVGQRGATGELTGILLDDFLSRAGWNHLPEAQKSSYTVHVEGVAGEQVEFPLGDPRVWLVADPTKPQAELIELNEHGSVTRRVPGVRTIRVLPDSTRKN
jgi:hypothetical protein